LACAVEVRFSIERFSLDESLFDSSPPLGVSVPIFFYGAGIEFGEKRRIELSGCQTTR
jgi:hypothetical protein